ncbi:MAG: elongation factor P [Holosporaceae bacterium]|jgi:elongation factor P|nr:elongation factor P [Holosporaceae bacterium]
MNVSLKGQFMKVSGNELRIGMLIERNGKLWTVCKLQHVKPGKGGAYMQTELKEIKTGTKLNERFRSDESLERVRLDEEECQLLFKDGDLFTFMNMSTFDQLQIHKDVIGDAANFLQDNMIVNISMHEGEIIGVVLPDTVVMEIVEADAVVKGQTATASYKPAVLENGMRILVPPHIESGTKIVVNTSDASYVERAK